MRLSLFAGLAEAYGAPVWDWEDSPLPATAGELLAALQAARPDLPWTGVRLAVDQRYVSADQLVEPGQELALIPPVSGG